MSRNVSIQVLGSFMLLALLSLVSQVHAAAGDTGVECYIEIQGITKAPANAGSVHGDDSAPVGLKILGSSFTSGVPVNPLQLGSSSSGGGGGAGKINTQCDDLTLEMDANEIMPALFLHSMTQQHIVKTVITYYAPKKNGQGKEKFLVIRLEDVLISSFSFGQSGEEQPHNRVVLNFAKINMDISKDGKPVGSAGYDVKSKNKL